MPTTRPRRIRVALAVALIAAVATASAVPVTPSGAPPYADGVLPVGDGKVMTDGPRVGFVYLCPGFATTLTGAAVGGARKRGPWFTPDGRGYRPAAKPHVRGDVDAHGTFDVRIEDDRRTISTNALPVAHGIGQFPVAKDDPVRKIDPNPNYPAAHPIRYELPAQPRISGPPRCIGTQVGVMLQGAALLAPVDGQGRDAVAWEVQDRCDGHPEPSGIYHYHGPSPCLRGTGTDRVIGFALDGFPITGDRGEDGRQLFSRDLDQCHGGVADVVLDGRTVRTYRYAMTVDWPYSVACFRGAAPAAGADQQLQAQQRAQGSRTGPATGAAGEEGLQMPGRVHEHPR